MDRILVVCPSNAFYAPMAEGYLRYFLGQSVEVHSAGISPAYSIDGCAVEAMREDNIDISKQTLRTLDSYRTRQFDHLILLNIDDQQQAKKLPHSTQRLICNCTEPDLMADEEERLEIFQLIREEIKRCILRFIGTHYPRESTSLAD